MLKKNRSNIKKVNLNKKSDSLVVSEVKTESKSHLPRRDFFKLAATGGAALAVASCNNDPVEKVLPYINPPANLTLGKVYKFASACQDCAASCGIHARVVNGRVIGVEGNPDNPMNKGGLCTLGQSSPQELYSPSRIKSPLLNGAYSNWDASLIQVANKINQARSVDGKVLYVAPARRTYMSDMMERLITDIGGTVVHYDAMPYNSMISANKDLFGQAEIPFYDFAAAETLISFGADFLESWHSVAENSKAFADFHAYKPTRKSLYVHVSPHLSLTAAKADKWISCLPGHETLLALALTKYLLGQFPISSGPLKSISAKVENIDIDQVLTDIGLPKPDFIKLAEAFGVNGKGMAIAGGVSTANSENVNLHQAVALLNYVGGSINKTIKFGANYALAGDGNAKMQAAIAAMMKGQYDVVILNRVNILKIVPEPDTVNKALKNVKFVLGMFTNHNETSAVCQAVLPLATNFESFDAAQPKNNITVLQQPAMAKIPGFDYRSLGDIVIALVNQLGISISDFTGLKPPSDAGFADAQSLLKAYWRKEYYQPAVHGNFDIFWQSCLQFGGLYQPASYKQVSILSANIERLYFRAQYPKAKDLKLVLFNSNLANINGNSAGRAWLAEIPHPISQLSWDAWAEINPKTAAEYGIKHGDEIEVSSDNTKLKLAAYVYHGVYPGVVAIPAGLGTNLQFPNYSSRRGIFSPFTKDTADQLLWQKVGENALELLLFDVNSHSDLLIEADVSIKKTGAKSLMADADGQWRDDIHSLQSSVAAGYGDRSQKDRGLFRSVEYDDLAAGKIPDTDHHLRERNYTVKNGTATDFYNDVADQVKPDNIAYGFKSRDKIVYHDPYRFEMVIDLNRCTGCSACVVACYSENNIPVVGKERVTLNRQMSWIRIERYFDKDENGQIRTNLGPTCCQHCGNAGCEPVCPVYATYHNPDGLNAQVYNRCVGTRYCANNCAYKQRRFNWRTYEFPFPLNLQLNPAVSVRSKGVMEKCTFCVQRIESAKLDAKMSGELVTDGDVVTACQAACPTAAISFGNGQEKDSQVSQLKKDIRGYYQLEELNYRPAVTYLRKVLNSEI